MWDRLVCSAIELPAHIINDPSDVKAIQLHGPMIVFLA